VFLERDGKRSVALMNWAYRSGRQHQPVETLRVALPGVGPVSQVRSLAHGPLPLEAGRTVVLPRLEEIDLLIVE
jgi:hypothetical protein